MNARIPLLVHVGALLVLLGCGSPIVGAECRDGYTACDGLCVDLRADPAHCGACDASCGGFTCEEALCTSTPLPDVDGGADASVDDGPFLPDGGFDFPSVVVGMGCSIGTTTCGGGCVDPTIDAQHCGACGIACAADQFCSDGECVDLCEAPLVACDGACFDFMTDPRACGGCDRVCASGICEQGRCQDAIAGHLVVLGHDYRELAMETMQQIAGNSVFLARGAEVRTLIYRGDARRASYEGVEQAIDEVVLRDGRGWLKAPASADAITALLGGAHALLIHAQERATDARLQQLGEQWGLALTQFLARGGVIVVFEGPSSSNAGTFQLLQPSGLFEAAGRGETTGRLTVVTPGVGVAARTTRTYQAVRFSSHFEGVTSPGSVVVRDAQDRPVVIHRVVAP